MIPPAPSGRGHALPLISRDEFDPELNVIEGEGGGAVSVH
jgi:hypothetical protein